jgi:hypothetical protein
MTNFDAAWSHLAEQLTSTLGGSARSVRDSH